MVISVCREEIDALTQFQVVISFSVVALVKILKQGLLSMNLIIYACLLG